MNQVDANGNQEMEAFLLKLGRLRPTAANIRKIAEEYRKITDPAVRDAVTDFLFLNEKKDNPEKWVEDCLLPVIDVWDSIPENELKKAILGIAPENLFGICSRSPWFSDRIKESPALQEALILRTERYIGEKKALADSLEQDWNKGSRSPQYESARKQTTDAVFHLRSFLQKFPKSDEQNKLRCLEIMKENYPPAYFITMRALWNDMSASIQEKFFSFAEKNDVAIVPQMDREFEGDGIVLFLSNSSENNVDEAGKTRALDIWTGRKKIDFYDFIYLLIHFKDFSSNFSPTDRYPTSPLGNKISSRLLKQADKIFVSTPVFLNTYTSIHYLLEDAINKLPQDHRKRWFGLYFREMRKNIEGYDELPLNLGEKKLLQENANEICVKKLVMIGHPVLEDMVRDDPDVFLPLLRYIKKYKNNGNEMSFLVTRLQTSLASGRIWSKDENEEILEGGKDRTLATVFKHIASEVTTPDMMIVLMKNVVAAVRQKRTVDLPDPDGKKLLSLVKDAVINDGSRETLELAKEFVTKVCVKIVEKAMVNERAGKKELEDLMDVFTSLENEVSFSANCDMIL